MQKIQITNITKDIYTDEYLSDREKVWKDKINIYKKRGTPLWNGRVYYLYSIKGNIIYIGLCEYKDLILLDEFGINKIKNKYKLDFNFIYINVQIFLITTDGKYLFGTKNYNNYTEIIPVGGTLRLEDHNSINSFTDIREYAKKELEIETKIKVDSKKIKFIDIVNQDNICTFLFKYKIDNNLQSLLNIGEFDGEIYLERNEIFNYKKNIPNKRLKSVSNYI